MSRPTHSLWLWIPGLALGLIFGVFYSGLNPAVAHDDDVVIFDVDMNRPLSDADVEELKQVVEENPGRDIILQPLPGFEITDGMERRRQDAARAAAEDRKMADHVTQGMAEGLYVTGDAERSPCATRPPLKTTGAPAHHVMCDGNVVAAPSKVPFKRAFTKSGVEGELRLRMEELLDGVGGLEKATGFTSHFSNAAAMSDLRLSAEGVVDVDFNGLMVDQVGGLHTGYATHTMLEQIYRTLFQFRDVDAVRLTLDGDCDAFGASIGGPCQELDRALWEQMQHENRQSLPYFTIRARR